MEVKSHENGMHFLLETIQYVRNPISPNAKNQNQLSVLQCWCTIFILLIILGSVAFNSSSQLELGSDWWFSWCSAAIWHLISWRIHKILKKNHLTGKENTLQICCLFRHMIKKGLVMERDKGRTIRIIPVMEGQWITVNHCYFNRWLI